MSFDDRVVSLDPQEPPFCVRIEIRRRSPRAFEPSNWIEIPALFNHAGQVPVDLDRLYCIVASRLGVEMGSVKVVVQPTRFQIELGGKWFEASEQDAIVAFCKLRK